MNDAPNEEIRELVALERDAWVDPGEARARLAARLAVPLSAPAPLPRWTPKPWMLHALTGAIALAVGGAGGYWARGERPERVEVRYVDRIVAPAASTSAPAVPSASSPPTPSSTPSSHPKPPASARAPSDDDLTRERQLIDQARSALARGDGSAALAALTTHQESFPRGQFTEVREALAVQALVQTNQADRARERAARFHSSYPRSTYGPVVDDALSKIP